MAVRRNSIRNRRRRFSREKSESVVHDANPRPGKQLLYGGTVDRSQRCRGSRKRTSTWLVSPHVLSKRRSLVGARAAVRLGLSSSESSPQAVSPRFYSCFSRGKRSVLLPPESLPLFRRWTADGRPQTCGRPSEPHVKFSFLCSFSYQSSDLLPRPAVGSCALARRVFWGPFSKHVLYHCRRGSRGAHMEGLYWVSVSRDSTGVSGHQAQCDAAPGLHRPFATRTLQSVP